MTTILAKEHPRILQTLQGEQLCWQELTGRMVGVQLCYTGRIENTTERTQAYAGLELPKSGSEGMFQNIDQNFKKFLSVSAWIV